MYAIKTKIGWVAPVLQNRTFQMFHGGAKKDRLLIKNKFVALAYMKVIRNDGCDCTLFYIPPFVVKGNVFTNCAPDGVRK